MEKYNTQTRSILAFILLFIFFFSIEILFSQSLYEDDGPPIRHVKNKGTLLPSSNGSYDFNDGTVQGWTVFGPIDEGGDGPFPSNFSNSWVDPANYPTSGLTDPIGDNNGSYKICNTGGHGITNPGATWWYMYWWSPDLSASTDWQDADGYTIKLMNIMDYIGALPGTHLNLYVTLRLVVYDHDTGEDRYFKAYLDDQEITTWAEDPNWIHLSYDWTESMYPYVPNRTIKEIYVQIKGRMDDYFEGGIYLDEVAPIAGTTAPPEQKEPQLSINKDGYAVLCWTDYRDGDPRVYSQLYTNKGFPFISNIKVLDRAASVEQKHPDVAMNDLGHFVVVWQDDYSGNYDIYAQMYAANGVKIGSELKVNDDATTEDQTHPAIAMNGEGEFVICWTDNRDDRSDIYAQRYDSEGTALSSNFRVNEIASYSRGYSDIDMNESGDFVIVWQDARNSLVDYIYGRRYNNSGTSIDGEFQANADLLGELIHKTPSVALQNDGKFMVCYVIVGTVDVLYATHFNSDGSTLIDFFQVPDVGTSSNNASPAVTTHPNGGFSVVWHSDRNGTYDIFGRNFNNAGAPLGGSVRVHLNATDEQKNPCVGVDDRGVGVMAWEDNISGNWKINAFWLGPLSPLNPTAGDGFNGHVPLTWDHLYGYNDIDVYKIYRSTSPGGPYDPPITVDLSLRGPLGRQMMRDWIDTDVTNGTTYYYKISAIVLSAESQRSVEVSATPSSDGYQVIAGCSTTPPTIDGQISGGEWDDATEIDIANPDAPSPITLYVKNDDSYLYLAIDDPNDNLIDNANLWGIIFDEDNNNMWDATSSSEEGLITINNSSTFFTGYWGTYPNSLGADVPISTPGITKAISTVSGHVQYEASFDLTTSPINTAPGDTIGFCVMLDDPSNFYSYQYGYAGEWPLGALWDAAMPLGDLTLCDSFVPSPWIRTDIESKLLASDGEDGDVLGRDGDIDEGTIFVGAYGDSNAYGQDAGAVYIYQQGSDWTEVQKITSNDGAEEDYFGYAVGIDGNYAVVGAPWDDDGGEKSGSAYIFKRDGSTWSQEAKLTAEDAGEDNRFGIAVDISGDYTIVGAFFDEDYGTRSGSAYIFKRDGTTWSQQVKLTASDADTNDWFGVHVSIEGDYAVVGSRYDDNENGNDAGGVYVFKRDGTEWTEQQKLIASDGEEGDHFETGSIQGETIVVGAYDDDDMGLASGSVYVFERTGETWTEVDKFTASDGSAEDRFGSNTAISGNYLIIAAYRDQENGANSGSIYVFSHDGSTWSEETKIIASDGDPGDYFGDFIAIDQGNILVGARNDDDNGNNAGAAYVYEYDTSVDVESEYRYPIPEKFALMDNYPNPFNPATTINYELPKATVVNISIYNVAGQLIETLVDEHKHAGYHTVQWDASQFGSGIYFYKMVAGGYSTTKKCLILK